MSDDLVSQKRQVIEKCIEVVSTVLGETEDILQTSAAIYQQKLHPFLQSLLGNAGR
jgi:hypothetical protein